MQQLSYGDGRIAALEKERMQIYEKVRRLWRSAGGGLLLMVGMTVYLYLTYAGGPNQKFWIAGAVLTGVGLLTGLIFWAILSHKFTKKFHASVLPVIVEKVWPDAEWDPRGLIDMQLLYDAELVRSGKRIDRYDGSDLFTGTWAGLPIEMSYVKAEDRRTRRRKNKTETYYATLFAGIVLRAERLGHPGFTKLTYRPPGWDLSGILPGWMTGMTGRPEIQLETNDPLLGKRFTLESDEPEAGRALVTEELLVVLHKLKMAGKGTPTVVLTPLSLYVILEGEDFAFSPSYREPVHKQATVGKQYEEFQHLLRIVELLAQEERYG